MIFVPGSGRDGAAAWPQQGPGAWGDEFDVTYLEHADGGASAASIVKALGERGGHVVAHSAGAVAATLAAAERPELFHSLMMFEPACFGLARGGPEVERHVADMSPVFRLAGDANVTDAEFGAHFLAALGVPPPLPPDPVLAGMGARLRAEPPPWEHGGDSGFLASVRTLVVTGAWNPLYDEVADAMERAGAVHTVMAGYEHRPQDSASANGLLLKHWRSGHERRGGAGSR